ncbi:MAG TPA: NAD-dependent epimerase/dehydratase family protein [Polyangia bacterium]|jgi:uncharacterized protein YbjT (DUF2867 family)
MRVIVFGGSGMIGQGVVRECLRDATVERVLVVGRTPIGVANDKLEELVHGDLYDLSPVAARLAGFDACFFCLGVSSAGMNEADYTRVTYALTLAVAERLAKLNPQMTFIYVSGAGTDSTERGRSMWARVKGKTENALMRLPFRASFMFRPGYVQPLDGITSKTRMYRVIYAVVGWMFPVWRALFPSLVTTTEEVGRAMIAMAKRGGPSAIVENREISATGRRSLDRR